MGSRNYFFMSSLSCVPSFNFLLCLQLVKKFVVVVWWCGGGGGGVVVVVLCGGVWCGGVVWWCGGVVVW